MRFTLAALFFLIMSFIFFVSWAVSSYVLTEVDDALTPLATGFSSSNFNDLVTLLPTAFGIICALFFITGILLIFVMDSLADEPEMYWRP
jgi:hypothetical protein